MKRIALLFFLLGSLIAQSVAQTPVPLSDLVLSVFEQSASVDQALLRERLSRIARDSIFGSVTPDLTLNADPAYGLRSARVPDPTAIPPDNTDTLSQSTGLSLSARQLLPTGGVLVGEIGAGFSATTSDPYGSDPATTFSLSPSFSLSVSQPLFVDGSFVDLQQFSLTRESATLGVTTAAAGTHAVREQVVLTVLNLASRRNALRRAVESQVLQQGLVEQRLEEARIREEQGQGSRQERISLQVQLNGLRDAELQSRFAARELEFELARLSGIALTPETEILIPVPSGTAAQEVAQPTELVQARNELEAARIEYQLSRKEPVVTADLFVSLTPRYADQRENPETLWGAFSDYEGEGAGLDVAAGINLSIPLSEGATRRRAVERAGVSVELAESTLAQREREVASSIELNALRVDTLEQRIALLEFDLEFQREQLESDLQLQRLGAVTPFQVSQRQASIRSVEINIHNLRAELYLAHLERHRLRGGDPVVFVTGRQTGVE